MVLLGYFLSQVDLVLLIFDFVFKKSLKDHAFCEVQVFQTINVAHEFISLKALNELIVHYLLLVDLVLVFDPVYDLNHIVDLSFLLCDLFPVLLRHTILAPIFGSLRWVLRHQCLYPSIVKVRSRQLEQFVEAAIPLGWLLLCLLQINRVKHRRAVSPREVLPQDPEVGTSELGDFLLDLVSIQNGGEGYRGVILEGGLLLVLCFLEELFTAHSFLLSKWRLLNSRISQLFVRNLKARAALIKSKRC